MHPTLLTHDDALTATEKARERAADLAGIDAMLDLEDKLTAVIADAHALVRDGRAMAAVRDLAQDALEITRHRRRIAEEMTP